MNINRGLTAKVLFAIMLIVLGAGYFAGRQPTPASVPGIETSTCGAFADTYEHNSSDPNHIHITNVYGVNAQGNHTHVTKDYLDWLKSNLSTYTPADQAGEYGKITPAKLAGMLYSLYRWCRASPMDPFVSAIPAVLNKLPVPDSYVEGQDGE